MDEGCVEYDAKISTFDVSDRFGNEGIRGKRPRLMASLVLLVLRYVFEDPTLRLRHIGYLTDKVPIGNHDQGGIEHLEA